MLLGVLLKYFKAEYVWRHLKGGEELEPIIARLIRAITIYVELIQPVYRYTNCVSVVNKWTSG